MAPQSWRPAAWLLYDAGPVPHAYGSRVPDRPRAGRRGAASGVSHLAAWWRRLLFAGPNASPPRRAQRHHGIPADRDTLRAAYTWRKHGESQLFDLLHTGLESWGEDAGAVAGRSFPARFVGVLQCQIPARVGAAVCGAADVDGAAGCRLCHLSHRRRESDGSQRAHALAAPACRPRHPHAAPAGRTGTEHRKVIRARRTMDERPA